MYIFISDVFLNEFSLIMFFIIYLFILYFIIINKNIFIFFFFFQAEDGIRDYKVTGFRRVLFRSSSAYACVATLQSSVRDELAPIAALQEIGRASCRERVESPVVAVSLKEKKE